jgi:uncharacterized protein YbjQ (UPF0145 family)
LPVSDDDKRALVKQQPYPIAPHEPIRGNMVTTAFQLEGFRVVKSLGVVRGIIVRSRSAVGSLGAAFQTLFGGNITIFTKLCEQTRAEAFHIMQAHAAELGANAIIGMRYDATEIMGGVTEVLAYGTAVVVEPDSGAYR